VRVRPVSNDVPEVDVTVIDCDASESVTVVAALCAAL
jgi:hypothetical protein